MPTVGWDFNNLNYLWLISVRAHQTLFASSDSFLISTTSHFLMTFLQAGKRDNLRFQEIFKMQLMAFGLYCEVKITPTATDF